MSLVAASAVISSAEGSWVKQCRHIAQCSKAPGSGSDLCPLWSRLGGSVILHSHWMHSLSDPKLIWRGKFTYFPVLATAAERGLIYFPYTPPQPRAWQEALPHRNEVVTLSLDISPRSSLETMSIRTFSINTLTLTHTHTPQDYKKAVTYPINHVLWQGGVIVVGVIKATIRTSVLRKNKAESQGNSLQWWV